MAVFKGVFKDMGMPEDVIDFDVGMGVLIESDMRVGELKGEGTQVQVDINVGGNVDSMVSKWKITGADVQMLVDRRLRE